MLRKIADNKSMLWFIGAILMIGILFFVLIRGKEDNWAKGSDGQWVKHGNPAVYDFDTCAKEYPIQESYPERCAIPKGPTFTKGSSKIQ